MSVCVCMHACVRVCVCVYGQCVFVRQSQRKKEVRGR